MLPDLRLYQLVSPTLPIGSFTYSQGLEWAVEAQWVHDEETLENWLASMLQHSIASLELPVLLRLQQAFSAGDQLAVKRWCQYLIASRETSELRKEELQRGAALIRLLPNLDINIPDGMEKTVASSQLCGIALAAVQWGIDTEKSMAGYCWSWLENTVMAGVKLIPLGQTQGQKILYRLSELVPGAIAQAQSINDSDVGSCTPALAIASSCHENQYTRLFRS
jgi:urease accessory protein